MADCNTGDFLFPLSAEIFYPIVEQGAYGNVKKQWMYDRNIAISVASPGSAMKEEVTPNVNITQEKVLVGRSKQDLRVTSEDGNNSITNVVISNIKDRSCNPIYMETSGVRANKSTIFEVASQEPYVGPFGKVEYYKIVLRRSENQAVDI
jgi:hypothetical protein